MLKVKIFTLYPDLFPVRLMLEYIKGPGKKDMSLDIIDIRTAAKDKHQTVDDKPYGGGSGMV